MRDEIVGLEPRLSALGGFVVYPPTPDLVAQSMETRKTAATSRWTGLRRLAPLAAGLGVVVLIAATVLSASSSARAAVEDVLEAGGVNPFKGDKEGVYTTHAFAPRFRITLPEGYAVAVDTRDAFAPGVIAGPNDPQFEGQVDPIFPQLGIYKTPGWALPGTTGSVIRGTTAPVDSVAWLRNHPCLDTTRGQPVSVGGVEGIQIDASWSCPESAGPATLFYIENPVPYLLSNPGAFGCCTRTQLASFNLAINALPGFWLRLILLEVRGEDLVIIFDSPENVELGYAYLDAHLEQTIQPMLDSIVFLEEAEQGAGRVVVPLLPVTTTEPVQEGAATLADNGDGTTYMRMVIRRTPGNTYPVRIHHGTCDNLGEVFYVVEAGPQFGRDAVITADIPAALSELQTGDYAITAQGPDLNARGHSACGDIPPE